MRSLINLRLAVTVPPRRFGAERRNDAVDEINSSRASDAQQRADNSAVSANCKQKVMKSPYFEKAARYDKINPSQWDANCAHNIPTTFQ